MTDELTLEEFLERGANAKQLLDNPMFRSVMDDLQRQCTDAIVTSRPEDHERREFLYFQVRAIQQIVNTLQWYEDQAEELRAHLDAEESTENA